MRAAARSDHPNFDRKMLLLQLGERLRGLRDSDDIESAAVTFLGEWLRGHSVFYSVIDQAADRAVIAREWTPNHEPLLRGTHELSGFGPELVAAFAAGQTVAVEDTLTAPETRAAADTYRRLNLRAFIGVPLVRDGNLVRTLGVLSRVPRSWAASEVALVEDVAERTWDAVERARIESRLRDNEERLRLALTATGLGTFIWYVAEDRGDPDSQMLALFGQPAEGALNLRTALGSMIHPDDRERYAAAVAAAADPAGGGALRQDIRVVFEDGRQQWLAITGQVFFAGQPPQPIRMFGSALDITPRKDVEAALHAAHDDLESRVAERTRELAHANERLQDEVTERRAAELQIKHLVRRLLTIQEAERRRISRDIHDQLGQSMTALRMNLEALRSRVAAGEMIVQIARVESLAAELDESIDFLTWDLRPAAIEHLGLSAALRALVNGWADRFALEASYAVAGVEGVRLPPEVEINLYRLAQEALHNVHKHAAARHVKVLLACRDEAVTLEITDDGEGFEPAKVSAPMIANGLGLAGMRERAALIGGELQIDSQPGCGTTVRISVPTNAEPRR